MRKVAIVGTGVIGSAWAALFAAKGYAVSAYVRSPASRDKFLKLLQQNHKRFLARGIASDPDSWKAVVCVLNLAECMGEADYVQESVVEELSLKQHILREIDEFAPPGVFIGSSTSFIPLSLLQATARRHPERVATAHPSLPQWDAFCEVLGANDAATAWLATFFTDDLGMDVVRMRHETVGHVFNTYLTSILATTLWLRAQGVCDVADINRALVHVGGCLVSAGGISGSLVGFIGGGRFPAAMDIGTDVVMNFPMSTTAVLLGRCLPRPLAWLFVGMIRPLLRPLALFRGFVRWCATQIWTLTGVPAYFDESPAAVAGFEAAALQRAALLERTRTVR